jgi:hypothetical protein
VSSTATAFLNGAKTEVNYREGRNNDNKYGRWYTTAKHDGLDWNHQAYCAIGLSWVANNVGALDILGGLWAYCPYWAAWWRKRGQWGKSTPNRGDIAFFDWTGKQRNGFEMHVAPVLERVDATHIRTIEFNTVAGTGNQSDGGGVFIRTRHISTVVGYGKPLWTPETKVQPIGHVAHEILVVDGVWGARTTKRLQELLHVNKTGVLDAVTLKALAVWLHQKSTGTFTLLMKTALQHRVGVSADGEIGPVTVRALQRYLNRL